MNDSLETAFPTNYSNFEGRYAYPGMTLRDYFAAKALQGIYSSPTVVRFANGTVAPDKMTNQIIAKIAYEQADAMLKVRGES